MMPHLHILLYLAGGGLLFALVDPPQGWGSIVLILGYILCAAYLDAWLSRVQRPRRPHAHGNVIPLASFRDHKFRRGGPFRLRSRTSSRSVFQSHSPERADELFQALLAEGLTPRIVQRHHPDAAESGLYELRLPEDQIEAAQPVVQRFRSMAAQIPS